MTLRIPAKVLLHVWSYDFYDMTLSTGKQRCHMIKNFLCCWRLMCVFIVLVKVTEWPPIGKIAAHSAYDMFHGIST